MSAAHKNKLPRAIRAPFEASLNSILEYHDSFKRLSDDLRRFELTLHTRLTEGQAIEIQVRRLLRTAKKLLTLCRMNPTEKYVPQCLAAIDYFVQSEDSMKDFSGLDSFDDDAAVFEAVIQEFGLKL